MPLRNHDTPDDPRLSKPIPQRPMSPSTSQPATSKPCPHLHWHPSLLYSDYEKCETCGAIRRIGL